MLLQIALGNKKNYHAWLDMIRDMQGRGLNVPLQITTDGAAGLIRAVEEA